MSEDNQEIDQQELDAMGRGDIPEETQEWATL